MDRAAKLDLEVSHLQRLQAEVSYQGWKLLHQWWVQKRDQWQQEVVRSVCEGEVEKAKIVAGRVEALGRVLHSLQALMNMEKELGNDEKE